MNVLLCCSIAKIVAMFWLRKRPHYRRARACPSPCCDLRADADYYFNRFAGFCQVFFTTTIARDRPSRYGERGRLRSRGTGPRATVKKTPPRSRTHKKRPGYRRARACPSPCTDRRGDIAKKIETGRALLPTTIAGDRPPRYGRRNARITVGRGPVPRQRSCTKKRL